MQTLLYSKYAKYYDIVYSKKDYLSEVGFIDSQILKSSKALLELACGTGNHTRHFLEKGYQVTGSDISAEMIELAKQKNPKANLFVADYRDCNLDQKFNVITLLFTSINYCLDLPEVEKTFQNCHRMLEDKGTLVFDLGLCKIKEKEGSDTFLESVQDLGYDIGRMSQWSPMNKERSKFKATYLTFIKEQNGNVDYGSDVHELGAFNLKDVIDLLNKVGFKEIKIFDGFRDKPISVTDDFSKIPVIFATK